jgi:hypothetical protein
VVVFNVEQSDSPTRIAQVPTPGDARAVSIAGTFLAVADGNAGLTIIDIADPPAARIRYTVPMPAQARAVATLGNFAFVGLANGMVVVVDMFTGEELARRTNLTGWGAVHDLGVSGSLLYVLQVNRLSVFDIFDGEIEHVTGVAAPGGVGAGQRRWRLFLGRDFAYANVYNGFNIFDLSNPRAPTRVGTFNNAQAGWKQIVTNGDGIGIAAVSPNSTNDGPHHVSYFTVGGTPAETVFVTEYPTLGLAAAVTLYNGLAYVADSAQGLQVINYLAFDNRGVPPTISMTVDAPGGEVEEGKVLVIEVEASDDVQVRNVTFLVDGEPVYSDGNYPYGFNLIAPLIAESLGGQFVLQARAVDTGGNIAVTEPVLLTLVPDNTPPRVRAFSPRSGALVGVIDSVSAVFNEPMNTATLGQGSVFLREAGADGLLGTADDVNVPVNLTYAEETMRILLDPGGDLPPGLYQAVIQAPAADLAGNPMERAFASSFRVFSFVDSDRDGVPDDVEIALGLDPNNPMTDGRTPDGQRDDDRDGLPLIGEILLGRDPTNPDSNGNGIPDGLEDSDNDGLNDGDEIRAGTDPTRIDSDGDGIDDAAELADGTDPNDPRSRAPYEIRTGIVSFVNGAPLNLGEFITVSIASGVVSFVNGVLGSADTGEGGLTVMISSGIVSYVNGVPGILDPESTEGTFRVSSSLVSYVNGVLGAADVSRRITSPLVSYENE